jgi:hypothetical protein
VPLHLLVADLPGLRLGQFASTHNKATLSDRPMVQYRRKRAPGGTYFITVTLSDRRSQALTVRIGRALASASLHPGYRPSAGVCR